MVGEKFSLNNDVKEVSIKILHKIYPTMKRKKKARCNIDIDLLCNFC